METNTLPSTGAILTWLSFIVQAQDILVNVYLTAHRTTKFEDMPKGYQQLIGTFDKLEAANADLLSSVPAEKVSEYLAQIEFGLHQLVALGSESDLQDDPEIAQHVMLANLYDLLLVKLYGFVPSSKKVEWNDPVKREWESGYFLMRAKEIILRMQNPPLSTVYEVLHNLHRAQEAIRHID